MKKVYVLEMNMSFSYNFNPKCDAVRFSPKETAENVCPADSKDKVDASTQTKTNDAEQVTSLESERAKTKPVAISVQELMEPSRPSLASSCGGLHKKYLFHHHVSTQRIIYHEIKLKLEIIRETQNKYKKENLISLGTENTWHDLIRENTWILMV